MDNDLKITANHVEQGGPHHTALKLIFNPKRLGPSDFGGGGQKTRYYLLLVTES